MKLPFSEELSIDKLSAVFTDTTNSYKYYWFLSQIEMVKKLNCYKIQIDEIILEMIGSAWYPIIYFKLSLGKQDQLSSAINELQKIFSFPKTIRKQELILTLKNHSNDPIVKKMILNFSRYVPYRFLTPWYSELLRGLPDNGKNCLINELANKDFSSRDNPVLYRIKDGYLEFNPKWTEYLIKHFAILEGYSKWHLIKYLEKNNSNIPNISEKLSPPETRNLTKAREYWNAYLELKKEVKCIYSNEDLSPQNYTIDHFLPWSFVAHDQLWNLVPTTKLVNSAKSNNLPSSQYIQKFTEIQFDAFHLNHSRISDKTFEDYTILFKTDTNQIINLSLIEFKEVLINNIEPLMQIATNMGFEKNWMLNH